MQCTPRRPILLMRILAQSLILLCLGASFAAVQMTMVLFTRAPRRKGERGLYEDLCGLIYSHIYIYTYIHLYIYILIYIYLYIHLYILMHIYIQHMILFIRFFFVYVYTLHTYIPSQNECCIMPTNLHSMDVLGCFGVNVHIYIYIYAIHGLDSTCPQLWAFQTSGSGQYELPCIPRTQLPIEGEEKCSSSLQPP